ncbi:thioredoxin family protein [Antrihabitans stalactiti]|uniref:Thioredoxin family protein n=1 Tax=Antrihabitans stalactiti TaxID=2584121 RepID=A0A848KHB8_9NOCA|nr:thioredoxin family protein [Antrihabitans stalactiti]NMN97138.1 thioredoxin family protein [Antrihabitans stalactiti]
MTQITVLLAVLALATAVGLAFRARAGKVRHTASSGDNDTAELLASVGVQSAVPTVLHFSADWCGPCAAVRRVVGQVVADLARTPNPPAEVEVDIDEHPRLAKKLGVMSLPTTFIFDGVATERFRISGVPTSADLRTALVQLSG